MVDNPIDLIIAALNSALESAITGLAQGLKGLRILYRKLKQLLGVVLVTLLFLFPFLFGLFMGIKEEIIWLIAIFSALLAIYAALIIRGFIKAVKMNTEPGSSPVAYRLPFSLIAVFTALDAGLMFYYVSTYHLGYNLIEEAASYFQHLREQYGLASFRQLY